MLHKCGSNCTETYHYVPMVFGTHITEESEILKFVSKPGLQEAYSIKFSAARLVPEGTRRYSRHNLWLVSGETLHKEE